MARLPAVLARRGDVEAIVSNQKAKAGAAGESFRGEGEFFTTLLADKVMVTSDRGREDHDGTDGDAWRGGAGPGAVLDMVLLPAVHDGASVRFSRVRGHGGRFPCGGGGHGAAFAAGALHARRVGTVVLGSAFATAGTLLKAGAVLSADVLAGRIAGWSSCVCIGVSMSVLFVVAMERLADLGMRDTGKALSFGALGAVGLSAAVSTLPFEGFAFAASALPVALGALLLSRRPSAGFSPCRHPADASADGPCASGDGGGGADGGERERSGTKLVAPVRPVLMMGAVEFAGCFASFRLWPRACRLSRWRLGRRSWRWCSWLDAPCWRIGST